MPHERGLLPVLPFEFCTLLSPDPQCVFLPLARQPLSTR